MAASYSSFLSTQYFSPAFNTALFDGPFRFYFSQGYESAALSMYHLIQEDYPRIWTKFKSWSDRTKKHVFILIYPTEKDMQKSFNLNFKSPLVNNWDEGLIIGLENPTDEDKFKVLFAEIIKQLECYHLAAPEYEI